MIRKYRKKPVVIDALQFLGTNRDEVCAFVGDAAEDKGSRGIAIRTLEGVMIASPHDFVIKGVTGEFYPCKPDVFEATYDAVERVT